MECLCNREERRQVSNDDGSNVLLTKLKETIDNKITDKTCTHWDSNPRMHYNHNLHSTLIRTLAHLSPSAHLHSSYTTHSPILTLWLTLVDSRDGFRRRARAVTH